MPEQYPFDPTLLAYDLSVMDPSGRILHLPRAGLTIEESPAELATIMRCRLPDVMTTEGHMADLVPVGSRYYVSIAERGPVGPALRSPTTSWGAGWDAPTGGTVGGIVAGSATELTRGVIHKVSRRGDSAEIEVEGSDNLASLLEHDVDLSVPADTPARDVLTTLFSGWGATLGDYAGPDVPLPEKTWRGERAAKVVDDILSYGPRQGAGQFLLRAQGDHFDIVAAGGNQPTYWLKTGAGAGVSSYTIDISKMVANVIVRQEIDQGAGEPPKVEDTTAEGASDYGGATRIVVRDEKSTTEISALEAQAELAQYGFPDMSFEHTTFDVPYIHKYDRLRISDRLLDGYFFVTGVSHDASQMRMQLRLITPQDFERQAHLLMLETQLDLLKGVREDELKAQKQDYKASVSATGESPVARLRKIAAPVMGRTYDSPGTLGRSVFDAEPAAGVLGDCSGFCAWMAHQLGCSLPPFTDAIAANTDLIATNETKGAKAGDLVLMWDGGVTQAGANYPHVQMYLTGNTVLESGGSSRSATGRSQIWEGPVSYSSAPRYEIRRSACINSALYPPKAGDTGGEDASTWEFV